MNKYNVKMNVTNVTFDQEIEYGKDVKHFTDIFEINPIPNKTIVYKTVTGIGATHSEIVSKRHSIIVLPHIAIVKAKYQHYKDKSVETLAIHGDVGYKEILTYLGTNSGFHKILTTPKGLDKIITIYKWANRLDSTLNYKKTFFLLIDECHKVIQDTDYRTDMLEVMDHFFDFENRAMVSATPLPPSDPRFAENDFKHVKLKPTFDHKQDLELLHVNSLVNGLKEYFDTNDSECYCIFFNSVVGINSLIKQLKLADYKIFCSKESADLQKLNSELNVSFEMGPFKKFNFFTSSFNNGLDIIIDEQPDVIILTDNAFKAHTLVDPFTDTLQIVGRFRKTKKKEVPYRKLTHINNYTHYTTPISEEQAISNVSHSAYAYEAITTLKMSLKDEGHYEMFDHALRSLKPYARLLDKTNALSHFLLDNYLERQRVKNYYQNPSTLRSAYLQTKLFSVIKNERKNYSKDILQRLGNPNLRYKKSTNKLMTNALLDLENYSGLDIFHNHRHTIATLSFIIYDAYNRLGEEEIRLLDYSRAKIAKALLKLDIDTGKNSFPIIDLMHSHFILNRPYKCSELKQTIQQMFDEYGIECTAKATDVERYFEFKFTKAKGERVYIFTDYKQLNSTLKRHV